ncbi:FtsQ-type POTRA domain-containing protein [Patescibacteria group bacterium]|nr:FtsQ-type POTRA domain-containing protein [Patescibacteria group bacterium]
MRKPLRFKRKKKRVSFLKFRFFWYATGILFFLTFLFYAVVFSSWLEIQEIKIQGTREISKERILLVVGDNFWQEFLGIPTNSILLFDIKGMEEKLSFAFPAMLHVTVERSLPQTLLVKVVEREQIGTWCSSICFAVDAEGVLFKEVEEQGEYVMFDFKGVATLGQELLEPSLLLTLLNFKERFQKAGEPLQFSIIVFEIGERGEVRGVTKEGWRILLNLKENMEWQQTKLELVLQQKIPLEKRGGLEYVDLRFGDQAYIKYQD